MDKWDHMWLDDALSVARKSKDPSTRVGAVIVTPENDKITEGWNGFPRGIADTEARYNDRDMKLRLVVHAEMNAVLNAVRLGVSVQHAKIYVVAIDKTGTVVGYPPCIRCAVELIQAGVTEYINPPLSIVAERWQKDCSFAIDTIKEAGLLYREVEYPEALAKGGLIDVRA